jgi:PAS domain S-box-containing protein
MSFTASAASPTTATGRDRRSPSPSQAATGQHHVQFYDKEEFLFDVVAGYLGVGLDAHQPLIVIATAAHRDAFCDRLAKDGFDVAAACRSGRLTLLDARETLATFMLNGTPIWDRFRATIGPVLEAAAAHGGQAPIRAYGEMVDLLCRDGNPQAALKVEQFWNDLGRLYPFVLLCAYAMERFSSDQQRQRFQQVCESHTHVAPTEDYVGESDPQALRRQISLLQQRSRALETELARSQQLEAALRAREQELTDFFENAVEGLHWVAADGTILWANPAELALLGYQADEYVGHNICEFHVDRAVIDDMLARLGRHETLRDHEARMRCKDGSMKHVLVSSNALFRDGELLHTRCFTRDVTQQRLLDVELRAQNEELQRTVRFSEMFVGILGHDLRNPVSAVMTSASLLLRRFKTEETITRPARRIVSSAERMSRMIDQLLDFAHIRLGRGLPLDRRQSDLGQLCRAASDEAETAGQPLRTELVVSGDPVGHWDADRLGQLVSNLVANAHAHGQAPITLRVDGNHPEWVRLEVSNGGVIPAATLPILFEPFRSGSERKGEGSSGLGLGLYITQQIVLAHAGAIEVASTPEQGTRFIITLPRYPQGTKSAFTELADRNCA